MDVVQFGLREDLGYRRPPATASFGELRHRGLPEILFVHSFLPEGVTICDVSTFAAMIEEAYNPPRTLLMLPPDADGDQRCYGVGNNGMWEWAAVVPGLRSGWRMTLAPERHGQREATVEAGLTEHDGELVPAAMVTFPVRVRPAGAPAEAGPVPFGPMDGMAYRRPPVTVSFDSLSARGLPRLLFVNSSLPEGITVCDITVFTAMIKDAQASGSLRFIRQDEHGNDQCVGLGGTGIWEWSVVRPGKPINGERYASPRQPICRILFAPEQDGKRLCTVDLSGYPGHEPEDDSPITFTIRVRAVSMVDLERGAASGDDPEDIAEGSDYTLSWLESCAPAAYALLRMLAVLPDMPVPLSALLSGSPPGTDLPGTEAAELVGPLLGNPADAGEAMRALHPKSFVLHVPGAGGIQMHPLARSATRARLTAEETAHWRQAGAALIEAALPTDAQDPVSQRTFARLLPLAQATLDPDSDGIRRIAGYLRAGGQQPGTA